MAIAIPKLIIDNVNKRAQRKADGNKIHDESGDVNIDALIDATNADVDNSTDMWDPNSQPSGLLTSMVDIAGLGAQPGEFRTQYGVINQALKDNPQAAAELEAVLWKVLEADGIINTITRDGKKLNNFTDKAIKYAAKADSVTKEINATNRIDVSEHAAPLGQTYGGERSQKNAKHISIKSQVDNIQKIENETKNHLGHMVKKINAPRLKMATDLFLEAIGPDFMTDQGYSTHPMAKLFDIGKPRFDYQQVYQI